MLTRVVVDETATHEDVVKASEGAFIQRIVEEGLYEHIEKIVDDTELPYGSSPLDK